MTENPEREMRPWDLLNPNEPKSPEAEKERRLSICAECPMFIHRTQQCRKCGCFMKLKTRLENAHCPLHKW